MSTPTNPRTSLSPISSAARRLAQASGFGAAPGARQPRAQQAAVGLALLLLLQWGALAQRAPLEGPWGERAASLMRAVDPANLSSGSAESPFEAKLARSAQGDDDAGDSGAQPMVAAQPALPAQGSAPLMAVAASAPLGSVPQGVRPQPAQTEAGALSAQASPMAAASASAPAAAFAVKNGSGAASSPASSPLASTGPAGSGGASPSDAALAALAIPAGQKGLLLVAGDSLADGYGQAARAAFPRDSRWEAFDAGRHSTGLANPAYHDWPRALAQLVAQRRPQAVALAVGANDTLDLRTTSGSWVHFGSDAWQAEYLLRVKDFIRAGSQSGARVAVFGLPPMRDPAFDQKMKLINRVLEQGAKEEGAVFVPADAAFGASFQRETSVGGHASVLRAGDGIHMTFAGYTIQARDAIAALGIGGAESAATASSEKDAKLSSAQND
jgi:hypothetical protein